MNRFRKRKKKRTILKVSGITAAVIALLAVIYIFGFQIREVSVKSDLKQFSESEVRAFMDGKKINNSLELWFLNKIGKSRKIDFYEKYTVTMNSPTKVTISAYEKKIRGRIKSGDTYAYIDDDGEILKISSQKIRKTPLITGIEHDDFKLYQKLKAKKPEAFTALTDTLNALGEYGFSVKKINVSKQCEVTIYIKKIQVQLGKARNLDGKMTALKDMYDNVIKYSGTLDMKNVSTSGIYTLKKPDSTKKSDSGKKE